MESDKIWRDNIGGRIEKLRKENGLTQKELATALGVQRETVNQWESNTRDLKTENTIKLADFFGETCDFILRGVRAESVDISRETGLTQDAIDSLSNINKWTTYRRVQFQSIINGLLTNEIFFKNVLEHCGMAISIQNGDAFGGLGKHSEPPEEIKQAVAEAVGKIKFANMTGYTDYIVVEKDIARDTQIQFATDAFKVMINQIVKEG